ncbi:MAG TPA: ABC transporter permease [Candidatus Acidoferrum sp.]|nr:ABC transporter permease [Candidatus Acidoferrum sp.]
MKNVWVIWRKELRSYFASPVAYAVLALFGLIFGWAFYSSTEQFVNYAYQAQLNGGAMRLSVNEYVIRGLLGLAGTIGLFLIPLISMRLFAEEKRNGTIELLLTSPVKDLSIIVGKWLGALALYACVLGMSVLNIALLFVWGKPDWKPILVAYLGLILQGGCLLALGALISSMTSNQIVAGGAAFFVSLLLYFLKFFTEFQSSTTSKVLNYASIVSHMENFSKGVLDLKDAVYYCTFIFLALFLTGRQLESLRWRS